MTNSANKIHLKVAFINEDIMPNGINLLYSLLLNLQTNLVTLPLIMSLMHMKKRLRLASGGSYYESSQNGE